MEIRAGFLCLVNFPKFSYWHQNLNYTEECKSLLLLTTELMFLGKLKIPVIGNNTSAGSEIYHILLHAKKINGYYLVAKLKQRQQLLEGREKISEDGNRNTYIHFLGKL